MKCLFKLALTLCLALSFSAQAFAADYSIPAVSGPEYAKPTSVEYVYTADGGAKANLNLSKDTALLPPAFGVGGAFPLNAISAPVIVNPGSSVVGGGPIVYPDAVTASTTQSATLFTDVTDELYYANGSLGTLRIPAIGLTVSIYEGTDSAMLAKGAGHFSETSIWNGNVALAAHNRGAERRGHRHPVHEAWDEDLFRDQRGEGGRNGPRGAGCVRGESDHPLYLRQGPAGSALVRPGGRGQLTEDGWTTLPCARSCGSFCPTPRRRL